MWTTSLYCQSWRGDLLLCGYLLGGLGRSLPWRGCLSPWRCQYAFCWSFHTRIHFVVSWGHVQSCGNQRWYDSWGVPQAQLEVWKSHGGIQRIHHVETDMRKCANPAFLVTVDMVTNTLIYRFIGPFTGSICLGMIGRRKLNFNACQFVQSSPAFGNEEFVVVGDDLFW